MAKRYLLPYAWELSPKTDSTLSSILIGTYHLMPDMPAIRKYTKNIHLDYYFTNKNSLYLESSLNMDEPLNRDDNEGLEAEMLHNVGFKLYAEIIVETFLGIESILMEHAEEHEIPIRSLEFPPEPLDLEAMGLGAIDITKSRMYQHKIPNISERTYRMGLPILLPLMKLLKIFVRRGEYLSARKYISGELPLDCGSYVAPIFEGDDEYLAEKIKKAAQQENIVAGIGFAHCIAVLDILEEDFNIKRIPESIFGQNR